MYRIFSIQRVYYAKNLQGLCITVLWSVFTIMIHNIPAEFHTLAWGGTLSLHIWRLSFYLHPFWTVLRREWLARHYGIEDAGDLAE